MTREEYTKNIELLNEYTRLYDLGTPAITDEAWDSLYFDCQAFEEETGYIDLKSPTSSVQYDVQNALKKVTHNHPMLSLDKTKDPAVLKKWIGNLDTIVMLKMDGLTCSIKYVDGKFVSAETRGNGQIGEDITENAKRLPSIPMTIPATGTVIVDGEVICKYDDFEEFSDSFKNPRNFASGSIRLQDADECEKRKLTFVAWDLISSDANFNDKLSEMEKLGFIVVEYEATSIEHLEEQQELLKQRAASKNYPIDGLVYRINDTQIWISKGKTDHAFQGSFAFKFYDQLFETELIGIDWTVGKTGTITPTAMFKPVKIDGTTVQRACIHNISIMRELLGDTPHVGQKIWIIKANCIIPQVVKADKS